jgi:hypothetical protein
MNLDYSCICFSTDKKIGLDVTVAAEYGQDTLMKMRLNISGLQNRRIFEYEDERDKLENLVFKFFSIS